MGNDVLKLTKNQFDTLNSQIGSKMWRMTHLYKIRDKNRNLVFITPNEIQTMMMDQVKGKAILRDYFLKYRQGGVSTWWLIWWLDETIFKKNTITAILSHKRESLTYLWEIIKTAFDNMPEQYKPSVNKYNETTLSFLGNNSMIFVSLSIRSTAIHNLHISEACFIEPRELRATFGAASPKTNITIETTANGIGNDGYNLYQEGKRGANGYDVHFYPWWIQKEYRTPNLSNSIINRSPDELKLPIDDEQVLWRRAKKQEIKEYFPQEFPEDDDSAFLTSGNPFFNIKKISTLLKEARDSGHEIKNNYGGHTYQQYEEFQKGDVYAAGADVAEGISGDYSVLAIMNVTKRRQAFVYKSRSTIDHFYRVCDKWCRYYGNAYLAIERNNHGHAVLLGLYENMKYPNLYIQDRETRLVTTHGLKESKDIIKIGWDTDRNTKTLMMHNLKEALEGDFSDDENTFQPEFLALDSNFLTECLTLRHNGEKIEAQSGFHDDAVIAWAICFQMYLRVKGKLNRPLNSKVYEQEIFLGSNLQSQVVL